MVTDAADVTCLLVGTSRQVGSAVTGSVGTWPLAHIQYAGGDHPSEKTGTYGCTIPGHWSLEYSQTSKKWAQNIAKYIEKSSAITKH